MAKITYDLFVEFNRDKSILQISIFQNEKYLRGVDRKYYNFIRTDGDHKSFKESIDIVKRRSEGTSSSKVDFEINKNLLSGSTD